MHQCPFGQMVIIFIGFADGVLVGGAPVRP